MRNDCETLYSFVKDLPIVDWHNHLDMQMLTRDEPLGSLCEVWVRADPYKHRAMRICGEPERVITGEAPETEKWAAWMRTLPKLVGNPLFAWAKMELAWLGLDVTSYLHGRGENVSLADWTPSKMLAKFGVEYLSPCVGADHDLIAQNSKATKVRVVPSLRMNAGDEVAVETLERFHAAGCRIVDISVDDVTQTLKHLNTQTLLDVAAYAATHGWTMLLHLGALRETSARLRVVAGPAGGFAGMRAPVDPAAVAALLDALESTPNPFSRKEHMGFLDPSRGTDAHTRTHANTQTRSTCLPRTILLSLNPAAHAQLAVLAGSFVEAGMPGKMQLGPAWWWCDHAEGIRDVLEKNAAYGVLSTFIGMTTDSRSLLSFVRHDYFRRILCTWMSEKIAAGAFPDDEALLCPLLADVCCGNARKCVV